MKKLIVLLVLSTALLSSCFKSSTDEKDIALKNPAGVYYGIVPGGDCPAVEYSLVMREDSTFFLKTIQYRDGGLNKISMDIGKWYIMEKSKIVLSSPPDNEYFQINGFQIVRIDSAPKDGKKAKPECKLSKIGELKKD